MMPRVESLNFRPDNPLAIQAAGILVAELDLLDPHDTSEQRVERYLAEMNSENFSHYALLNAPDSIVAAAIAAHRQNIHETYQTEVVALAVERRAQRQGFGRLLMKHVARQTLEHGDEMLSVWPIDKERRVPYEHFGFKSDGVIMRARPSDVLDS